MTVACLWGSFLLDWWCDGGGDDGGEACAESSSVVGKQSPTLFYSAVRTYCMHVAIIYTQHSQQ